MTRVPQQLRDIDVGVTDWDMVALGALVKRTVFSSPMTILGTSGNNFEEGV